MFFCIDFAVVAFSYKKNAYISYVHGMKKIIVDGLLLAVVSGLISCEKDAPGQEPPKKPVSEKQVKTIPFPIPQVFRDESAFNPSVEDTATTSSDSLSSESAESSSSMVAVANKPARPAEPEESSSSEPPAPTFCENVPAGMLCDNRDGHLYRIVTIGSQVWMAQNLNYRAEGSSCYENKAENCKLHGRLYPWTVAMGLDASYATHSAEAVLSKPHKGICPEGYHMPTSEDMKKLVSYIMKHNRYEKERSGTILKMAFSWKHSEEWPEGTDRFGFSAMASGFKNARGEFREMGHDADFWVAEESNNPSHAPYWNLYYDNDEFLGDYSKTKAYSYSVRCLRNKKSTSSETAAAEKAVAEAARADSIAHVAADSANHAIPVDSAQTAK